MCVSVYLCLCVLCIFDSTDNNNRNSQFVLFCSVYLSLQYWFNLADFAIFSVRRRRVCGSGASVYQYRWFFVLFFNGYFRYWCRSGYGCERIVMLWCRLLLLLLLIIHSCGWCYIWCGRKICCRTGCCMHYFRNHCNRLIFIICIIFGWLLIDRCQLLHMDWNLIRLCTPIETQKKRKKLTISVLMSRMTAPVNNQWIILF